MQTASTGAAILLYTYTWNARKESYCLDPDGRMYRGRCGPFHQEKKPAEEVLNDMLSGWMDDLVAGADLARTSLDKKYPATVYRHCQSSGDITSPSSGTIETFADDFHSPVQPERYIALRLKPMMAFYQNRIPAYTRSATLMLMTLGMFSVAASMLSFFGFPNIVVVVTAGGASITSYLEFADTQRKIERYTRAVRSIKKILNWWSTLDSVERAGASATSNLLTTGEAIIAEERLAWQPLNIGLRGGAAAASELQEAPRDTSHDLENGTLSNRVHPSG